ncbi:hypothetical protein RRG08_018754 [Elysia crispata]|uniref:Uncharacterized protein n=1 Tax=Elysia crispata TaxID=231223 RepID=A0AAE1DAX7_9GAST|nr:hypothetical protein RRG08_018754 [Elysia crispata]
MLGVITSPSCALSEHRYQVSGEPWSDVRGDNLAKLCFVGTSLSIFYLVRQKALRLNHVICLQTRSASRVVLLDALLLMVSIKSCTVGCSAHNGQHQELYCWMLCS